MSFKLLVASVLFLPAVHSRATCSDIVTYEPPNSGTFNRQNYRFMFKDGFEMNLVLDSFRGNRLIDSFAVFGNLDAVESIEGASVRFYSRHVFEMTRMWLSGDGRLLKLIDDGEKMELTLTLRDPFHPGDMTVEKIKIDTNYEWVKENFPRTAGRKNFHLGPEYLREDLNFSYRGGAAKLINDVLPQSVSNNIDNRIFYLSREVRRIMDIINNTPYARSMSINVKYYRGLFVIELDIGDKTEVYVFPVIHTPLELADMASGLRSLGLIPTHPIFNHVRKVTSVPNAGN